MFRKLKKAINYYWARSKGFRFAMIISLVAIAFLIIIASLIFLVTTVISNEYYRLIFYILLTGLLVIFHKRGYGKQFPPEQRKLILAVSFCLGISIIILAFLRETGRL